MIGVLGCQWNQLDHMQTICTSLQIDYYTNTSSLNFYRPDALSLKELMRQGMSDTYCRAMTF